METIEISVLIGVLSQQVYKNSTIDTPNLKLVGRELILEGNKKVVSYNGSIFNKEGVEIGRFNYINAGTDTTARPEGYRCEISVNKEENAALQVEATKGLLQGIGEYQKGI